MAPQQVDWVTQRNRKDKVDKVLVHDKDDNDADKVVEMMKEGDWRRVLQEFQGDDCYREPLLVDIYLHISTHIYTYLQVWIRPSLLSLEFIRQEVTSLGLEAVASVGCGCGTLEWLLQMATGRCSIELETKVHTKVRNRFHITKLHEWGEYLQRWFLGFKGMRSMRTLRQKRRSRTKLGSKNCVTIFGAEFGSAAAEYGPIRKKL